MANPLQPQYVPSKRQLNLVKKMQKVNSEVESFLSEQGQLEHIKGTVGLDSQQTARLGYVVDKLGMLRAELNKLNAKMARS